MPLFITFTLLLYRVFCAVGWLCRMVCFWKKRSPCVQPQQWNDPKHAALMRLSASEAAAQIRSGRVKSEQLVRCYIERMKAVNPYINGAIAYRFEEALTKAREVDELLAQGTVSSEYSQENKPLLGVPCTIKESFSLTGMPHTGGLTKRKGTVATKESPVVRRLLDAGAIPIATTNCSELCMWYESSNNVYGTTNNPYNIGHMVGGSSGGEGAINGAACSVFGIGSDIGGSVRMPCFFCGVFGHKHSSYLTPTGGEFPPTTGEALAFLARSPMCRSAADLPLVLDIMAGNAVAGTTSLSSKAASVDVAKLKFCSIANDGGSWYSSPVARDLVAAQEQVVEHLRSVLRADVKVTRVSKLKYSVDIWLAGLDEKDSGPTFRSYMANLDGSVQPFWEFAKWLVGGSNHTLPCIGLGAIEQLTALIRSQRRLDKIKAIGQCLKTELEDLLGPDGVLIYPSHPNVAPPHHKAIFMPFNFAYTAVFNILGFPVTQVPLGLNSEGLPLGVQIVSTPGNDHLTMAVAMKLEQTMPKCGWVCPPDFPL